MNQIDLLKRVLSASVYPESADRPIERKPVTSPKGFVRKFIVGLAAKRGIRLVKRVRYDAAAREEGRDWPGFAYTMVGHKRLDNVQHAVETVLTENIPGDIVECGVWRGGCTILMRAVLDQHGSDRTVWAADSFEGMPKPNRAFPCDKDYDLSQTEYLSIPLDVVKANFERFGLGNGVRFLKGWFKDTLPTAPIDRIAVLRADGDLYESTMDILTNLYAKMSSGGFVIIDDYNNWPPCKQAVTEFREKHGITSQLIEIDWCSVYWRV